LIGENGTGKTHILKALYASADISTTKRSFAEKINKVFLPSQEHIGRLVKRGYGKSSGFIEIHRENEKEHLWLHLSLSSSHKTPESTKITGHTSKWTLFPIESVFIPVKEMLANAVGFRSLYDSRKIAFEEVYADIITKALMPILRGPASEDRKKITAILQGAIEGKVTNKNEEFYLRNKQGNLEFTLLAEGFRKLGLLWTLLQNGTLLSGSVLFWDEPETNLNPKLIKTVIEILIELQRMGVQIFLATHNYVILKEFDLQINSTDKIYYHSLFRNKKTKEIECFTTDQYDQLNPNDILDTFTDMYDREITRSY
jgi:AAA15 family ATPase/GTPase